MSRAMLMQTPASRFARVQIWRRGIALGIDWLAPWITSALIGGRGIGVQIFQAIVFLGVWLALRGLVVYHNQGQSLGRWSVDITVVDLRLGRVPPLLELVKRETIAGLGSWLVLVGLQGLLTSNAGGLLLLLPFLGDCALAIADEKYRQAFHDRIGQTRVVQTRRGYSLDLKMKQLLVEATRRVKR